ncbi:hypothetical protein JST97_16420 [bacterium]|nr:hypothetical protein [bacterium]
MKNLIAAALMTVVLGMAATAEPVVEKLPKTEPSPAPVVTTATATTQSPAQPELKKDENPAEKAAPQTEKPAPTRKPVELKFRDF